MKHSHLIVVLTMFSLAMLLVFAWNDSVTGAVGHCALMLWGLYRLPESVQLDRAISARQQFERNPTPENLECWDRELSKLRP